MFGNRLSELCSMKDNIFVPIFILRCINNIERDPENFKVDGLYRISGNAAKIQKIRFEVRVESLLMIFFNSANGSFKILPIFERIY